MKENSTVTLQGLIILARQAAQANEAALDAECSSSYGTPEIKASPRLSSQTLHRLDQLLADVSNTPARNAPEFAAKAALLLRQYSDYFVSIDFGHAALLSLLRDAERLAGLPDDPRAAAHQEQAGMTEHLARTDAMTNHQTATRTLTADKLAALITVKDQLSSMLDVATDNPAQLSSKDVESFLEAVDDKVSELANIIGDIADPVSSSNDQEPARLRSVNYIDIESGLQRLQGLARCAGRFARELDFPSPDPEDLSDVVTLVCEVEEHTDSLRSDFYAYLETLRREKRLARASADIADPAVAIHS